MINFINIVHPVNCIKRVAVKSIFSLAKFSLPLGLILVAGVNWARAAVGEFSGSIVKCGPGGVGAGYVNGECDKEEFFVLVHTVIKFGIYIGIIAVTLAVAFAAVMYMVSRGQSEMLGKAKGAITAAVIGLVVILLAWLIVNTILSTIFGCANWNVFDPATVSTVCTGL